MTGRLPYCQLLSCLALLMTVTACRRSQDNPPSASPAPTTGTKAESAVESEGEVKPAAATPIHDPKECEGKPVVTLEERTADGILFRTYQVVKGADGTDIPHGLNTLFFPTGQKKLEVHYVCGVAHGPRTAWYEDGKSRSQGENVNGKNHGVWTVWFPDGLKSQEFTMDHGAWHGTYTTWHPNGQMRMQVEYVRGLQQGPLKQFDENGVLVRSVDQVDGVPQPMPGGRIVD